MPRRRAHPERRRGGAALRFLGHRLASQDDPGSERRRCARPSRSEPAVVASAKSIPAWAIEETVLEQIYIRDSNVDVRTEAPSAQLRLVRLWIGRVDYDAAQNKLAITFNPTGSTLSSAERTDDTQETNP